MSDLVRSVIVGSIGGLLILASFLAIKENMASIYMSVSEFAFYRARALHLLRYFAFRITTPVVVFLLIISVYQKYFAGKYVGAAIVIAALVSLIPRDVFRLFSGMVPIREKLMHAVNIFVLFVICLLMYAFALIVNVSSLAPSIQGLTDNLWSGFIAVLIVVLFVLLTRAPAAAPYNPPSRQYNVVERYTNGIMKQYMEKIRRSCDRHGCSAPLLVSVLTLEDMNRPRIVRLVENALVRIPHVSLTVGIGQVKSDVPLTDDESIERAAGILENTEATVTNAFKAHSLSTSLIRNLLKEYNEDPRYCEDVLSVLRHLTYNHPELF